MFNSLFEIKIGNRETVKTVHKKNNFSISPRLKSWANMNRAVKTTVLTVSKIHFTQRIMLKNYSKIIVLFS